jgi:hypothetical protein
MGSKVKGKIAKAMMFSKKLLRSLEKNPGILEIKGMEIDRIEGN